MTSERLPMRRNRTPNWYMKRITIGVTSQATKSPGTPRRRMLPKSTSAPSSTRPVLMYSSLRSAGRSHSGVRTVLAMRSPSRSAQKAYPKPAARTPAWLASV